MVILWYYNGIIIGGRVLLRGIFNEGKTWRFMVKNYFSRKYLELSDVLCIFASDDILWHLNIKTKYYYNYEEVSTDYNPRPVSILCN